ncbi:hypothetical protein BC832DRAFT_589498 [Gaertneriomyces semiglobifer]|nr:hypothetical protein BC832DRAFT_589498 [Gaertneriomyces semiglobifer]
MAQDTPSEAIKNAEFAEFAEFRAELCAEVRAKLSRMDEEFNALFAEIEIQHTMIAQEQAQIRERMEYVQEHVAGMKDALRGVASLYVERSKPRGVRGYTD